VRRTCVMRFTRGLNNCPSPRQMLRGHRSPLLRRSVGISKEYSRDAPEPPSFLFKSTPGATRKLRVTASGRMPLWTMMSLPDYI
jgi:hypothetical protein